MIDMSIRTFILLFFQTITNVCLFHGSSFSESEVSLNRKGKPAGKPLNFMKVQGEPPVMFVGIHPLISSLKFVISLINIHQVLRVNLAAIYPINPHSLYPYSIATFIEYPWEIFPIPLYPNRFSHSFHDFPIVSMIFP